MKLVNQLIRPEILRCQPYNASSVDYPVKLDAMESPYPLPGELREKWVDSLKNVPINRYPDSRASFLKSRLREFMSIPDSLSLILGNGSDELIQIICMAFYGQDRPFMAPAPTFVVYQLIADWLATDLKYVQLDADDFSLDPEAILQAINKYNPIVIFIANPNNPTGNLFDEKLILEIINQAKGLVVIDEAYYTYSGCSLVDHICEHENLVAIRTLSKCGMAGLRLGCLIGPVQWIEQFEKIRLPYNINSLSQLSADFLLSHRSVIDGWIKAICHERERLLIDLTRLDGVKVWPSKTNFILFRTLNRPADEIHQGLRNKGIIIKNLHGSSPLLTNCLRVSIGTENENQCFLEELNQLL